MDGMGLGMLAEQVKLFEDVGIESHLIDLSFMIILDSLTFSVFHF